MHFSERCESRNRCQTDLDGLAGRERGGERDDELEAMRFARSLADRYNDLHQRTVPQGESSCA